ncbi:MAG: hypothetical protein KatS3mg087_0131 [Patescibacteria group bacterium]|nr:MAG: hypothetical protein KatS3mg087_0131 [Patescibacteria group bacterium]
MPCEKKTPVKIRTRKIKRVPASVKEAMAFIIKQAMVEMVKTVQRNSGSTNSKQ